MRVFGLYFVLFPQIFGYRVMRNEIKDILKVISLDEQKNIEQLGRHLMKEQHDHEAPKSDHKIQSIWKTGSPEILVNRFGLPVELYRIV
ncbi:Oidioi.mRNA.OKI2018_I69.chr1.g1163.t1.cds [Oikopleura dioica]|uniref:Oidioi.mRNA.OKI2018_I69.chr1.g1163.t1.cds n=1 Tax=Oikopleura dioica TaxID=34765 RepID=A0ABN7SML4_OIKDI|nr:Oidioi.mRNA.OKI2018_I69.chr1.g1163.t1.cds [Oikopleura dioica]